MSALLGPVQSDRTVEVASLPFTSYVSQDGHLIDIYTPRVAHLIAFNLAPGSGLLSEQLKLVKACTAMEGSQLSDEVLASLSLRDLSKISSEISRSLM